MGTISTETQQLAEAVRLACIELRSKINGNDATLNALNTTAKGSLVAAINEVLSLAGGGGSGAWADITGKPAAVTALSGTNTGDQDLSGLATTAALTSGLAGKAPSSGIAPSAIAGTALVNGGNAGTPSAIVLTNATGTASGLTAGNATTVDGFSRGVNSTITTGNSGNISIVANGNLNLQTGHFLNLTTTANSTPTFPPGTATLLATNGSGASLTNLNGSNITTGDIPVARIATALNAGGNPISGTTGTFSGAVSLNGGGNIDGTSGAINITASGTNQNITLTPSGTGRTIGKRITFSTTASAGYDLDQYALIYESKAIFSGSGLGLNSSATITWGPNSNTYASANVRLRWTATKTLTFDDNAGGAATFAITGNLTASGTVTGTEQGSTPAAPAANGYVLYAEDNGSGKTRLMVRFATGASQQLAIEP